jgi:drug/metabolite transporter superfamily protein YnfA
MPDLNPGRRGGGVAFLVSAGLVYEVIAAACSSPQTTEINAGLRAGTLMKWVHLGAANALLFVVAAAFIDPEHAGPVVAGGVLALAVLYLMYVHARDAGLRRGGAATEVPGGTG